MLNYNSDSKVRKRFQCTARTVNDVVFLRVRYREVVRNTHAATLVSALASAKTTHVAMEACLEIPQLCASILYP